MPNYAKDKEKLLRERSAVFNADKLSKNTPILLLHGSADWRVVPEESLNMALAMQKAIMVPLYYDEVIRFTRKNVKGLGINPINLLDLRRVRKEE